MSKVILDSAHFDSKARQWDENPVFQDRANKIAAAIAAAVPLNISMRTLDYGSGTGMLSFPLQDLLGQITLKDTSAGMLAVAEEKIAAWGIGNMTTRLMDLTAEPMPDEKRSRRAIAFREVSPTESRRGKEDDSCPRSKRHP